MVRSLNSGVVELTKQTDPNYIIRMKKKHKPNSNYIVMTKKYITTHTTRKGNSKLSDRTCDIVRN